MFRVVTVAREYGSGGGLIAQRLANRLGWKLLDRCLIEKIAEAARVELAVAEQYDEHPDPWFNSLAKALWQGGGLRGFIPSPPESIPGMLDADKVAAISKHLVEEAATIGNCVIVGRGSQCILQQREDTFHVFVYAPWAERLRRVRSRQLELSEAEAKAAIDAQDHARRTYVHRYFHLDWSNPHLYHLMLCSSLGEDAAVSTIMQAMGRMPEESVPPDQGRRHDG